jgi:dihydrofolate reductase
VPPRVTLVVAAAANGVIGRDGALPWRLPDDLKRFKALTLGKPILMGRCTFESIGRPLPGRLNIVITRNADFIAPPGVVVVTGLHAALEAAGDAPEVMVIGGAEIYALALPIASRVHLTRVHADVVGDTRFPALDPQDWATVAAEERPADAAHSAALSFLELERRTRRASGGSIMPKEDLPDLLRRLHLELQNAPTLDAESRELLSVVARDLEKFATHVSTARELAVRFEVDHPELSGALRQLADTFAKAGI